MDMEIVPYTADIVLWLEKLFHENPPVPTRQWAILDGTIEGRILVDKPAQPTVGIIQDLCEGTAYLGGAITATVLSEAFEILRKYQELVICLWPDDPLISALPAGNHYTGVAIDFTDRSPDVDLDRLATIPAGYRM